MARITLSGLPFAGRLMIGAAAALMFTGSLASAAEKAPPAPLKALLVTGGCCHDYETQKKVLSQGLAARANVEFTIVHQGGSATNSKIPLYEKADWATGYDVVVHNECFANVKEIEWLERILKPHREGTPAVVIHCAMHCYRAPSEEWFNFVGVTSRKHGAHYPFDVVNVAKDDPIMKNFGERWRTPKGELYQIISQGPNCQPLGQAMSVETKMNEVCIWKNTYGKARVFGTTVGHYVEEMEDPVFLNYLARGLLWSADKLNDDYLKPEPPGGFPPARAPETAGPQPTPAAK